MKQFVLVAAAVIVAGSVLAYVSQAGAHVYVLVVALALAAASIERIVAHTRGRL